MTRSALILLSIGVATLAACAQQAASAPASAASSSRECFNARNISSFTAQGESTIDIQAGVRRYYRLQIAGACTNVNWARKVAAGAVTTSARCGETGSTSPAVLARAV